ncbi:hypothetical protein [Streptomyces sp. NBC_01565]|uniref:zinc finger domain-containing protein n=1 Tax=Streptomyces sp. NBC_01565 TaxID=2975881 RepID=UPI00224F3FE2|nr:hypothetical protein [Streptomyces sp. NBC_01565]MCX4543823.1 hypothetical protein [Streptomyces sp. NBC_01565]
MTDIEYIDFEETSEVLALAAARDQRTVGEADILAWHADLNAGRVNRADAVAALTRFYSHEMAGLEPDERRRVTSPDVINLARKIRNERLENFLYEPPPGDSDPHYLARLRGQITEVMDGRRAPIAALSAGVPQPKMLALLPGVGQMPDMDDDEQRPIEAELIDEVRRSGPLGLVCPTCQAAIGRPCKTPGGSEKQPLGKPRAKPHTARLRAVSGRSSQTPEQRAAEEQRIRAMSARHLARQQAEADIPDAEIVEPEGEVA